MKLSTLVLSAAGTIVVAYPGMKGSHSDLLKHMHQRRQGGPPGGGLIGPGGPGNPINNPTLIGDLKNGNLSTVGQAIAICITGAQGVTHCQDNTPKVGSIC